MRYEDVFSFEHLLECANACLHGVTWKESTQLFGIDILNWVSELHMSLMRGIYYSKGFTNFTIHERGKIRHISSVHISERCVQKCLCRYALKPAIVPKLIYDNGATLENKGTDFALQRLREHLRWHLARYGRSGGILTMDYHNYFGSINHDILLRMLNNIIDDPRIYKMARYFINCFPGNIGLGLGSEISQICAVYYPNSIDHYFKDRLRVHGYGRYMDDSYIISDSIPKLKEYKDIMTDLSSALGLELNKNRTQIIKFDGGSFTYLKKRIFISNTNRIVMRLSRDNISNRRRIIKKHNRLIERGIIAKESRDQSFKSWKGYADKYNSYHTVKKLEELLT